MTLQVVGWVDIFTRKIYKDIIIENFSFCQKNKGLTIFAYVIMSNHVHLLVQSASGNLSDTIRDYKSFTSKIILNEIETSNECRKECLPAEASVQAGMLNRFHFNAGRHSRNSKYQFWTHENHPEHIYSNKFIAQKIEYIHNNPVRSGIVSKPENYIYSSARNYAALDSILDVFVLTLPWKTYR